MQSKPEDLVGANPGIAVMFQQKGLLEAQHLVFVGLTHMNTHARTLQLWNNNSSMEVCTSICYLPFLLFFSKLGEYIRWQGWFESAHQRNTKWNPASVCLSRRQRDARPVKYLLLVVLLPYSLCSCQVWAGDLVLLCCGLFLWRAGSEETHTHTKNIFPSYTFTPWLERSFILKSLYLCKIQDSY